MTQLTDEQAIVLSICTGTILIQPFRYVVEHVQQRLGRTVHPTEFFNEEFQKELIELYRPDLLKMVVVKPEIILPNE